MPQNELEKFKRQMMEREKEASLYNQWIPDYQHKIEIDSYLQKLSPRVGEVILDAGCGTGRITLEFSRKKGKVIAFDLSLNSLKICKKRATRIDNMFAPHFLRADIREIPLVSNVFDKILCSQVFEHIPTIEGRMKLLSELKRVIKPGGKMIVTTYNYDLISRIFRDKEGYHEGKIFYYKHDHVEFRKILFSVFGHGIEVTCILNLLMMGSKFGRMGVLLDKLIEKTPLSYLLGHLLQAEILFTKVC